MAQTGSFVNLSRNQLGPDPDPLPAHAVRWVIREGNRFRAVCRCGWQSGKRRSASIARESLDTHVEGADTAAVPR